jgi:hypothetical protein
MRPQDDFRTSVPLHPRYVRLSSNSVAKADIAEGPSRAKMGLEAIRTLPVLSSKN